MSRSALPTRNALAAVAGLLWALTFGAVRDFVWEDLRSGIVDSKGLAPQTRLVVHVGFLLLAGALLLMLFGDWWRGRFLLLAETGLIPGRGALVPTALIPLTLFLLALSWSYALTGALHAAPIFRVPIILLFLIFHGFWVTAGTVDTTAWHHIASLYLPLMGIVLLVLLGRRLPLAVAWQFLLLLVLLLTEYVSFQAQAVELWQATDTTLFLSVIGDNIHVLALLALPLLILIGLDIADFVIRSSTWSAQIAADRLGHRGLLPALLLALLWCGSIVWNDWQSFSTGQSLGDVLRGYAAAGVSMAAILAAWALTARSTQVSPQAVMAGAQRGAPWCVAAFFGSGIITLILFSALLFLDFGSAEEAFTAFIDRTLLDSQRLQMLLVTVGAIIAGLVIRQRGNRGTAFYLVALGGVLLWSDLTQPDRPLGAWSWEGPMATAWWFGLLLSLGLWWTVRGQLTAGRSAALLICTIALALVRQTDFTEDPLSTSIFLAGAGLVAFGLAWDALTAGAWTNVDSPRAPRVSRIFLYVGYVLFTATVVNWMLTVHNLSYTDSFSGEAAVAGFNFVGKPMVYAVIVLLLQAAQNRPWVPPATFVPTGGRPDDVPAEPAHDPKGT